MSFLWKDCGTSLGIPHNGWILIGVVDIREDYEDEDDTDYRICMMAGIKKLNMCTYYYQKLECR